jgi:hypothetical protein
MKFGEMSFSFNLIPMFLWIKLRGMISEIADKSTQELLDWPQSRHSSNGSWRPLLIKLRLSSSRFIVSIDNAFKQKIIITKMGTRIRLRDTHENKNKNVNNTEMNAICRLTSNRLSDSIATPTGIV